MARGRQRQSGQRQRTLDRSRSFTTINYLTVPEGKDVPVFKQDGALFNVSGFYIKDDPSAPQQKDDAPAAPKAAKSYVRGVQAQDDNVDRNARAATVGGADAAARAAVLANFGMSDPLDEQRSAMRENAAADAVERENAE